MNPNDVKKVIDNLINELGLSIVAYNSGPQLVRDNGRYPFCSRWVILTLMTLRTRKSIGILLK